MITQTGNALAELAERLTPKEVLNIEGRAVAHYIDFDALERVQRIVAELAKVRDTDNFIGDMIPHPFEASSAVRNCRAIAEEGVNNEG